MVRNPDIHVRLHDPELIRYWNALGRNPGEGMERLMKAGLQAMNRVDEDSEIDENVMVAPDTYYIHKIKGFDISTLFRNGKLGRERIRFIYRGCHLLIGEIEKDGELVECVPHLKDILG